MTLDDRKGYELCFERYGGRRPAVVMSTTFALRRFAAALVLEPCRRVEAEGLEGGSRFFLGVGGRERGEEPDGVRLVSGDQSGLGEIKVDCPRGVGGCLLAESQGGSTIVEAESQEHRAVIRNGAEESSTPNPRIRDLALAGGGE